MTKLANVRATLRADGWFGIAVQYDRDLAAALRRVRPHEYTRAVWIADARLQGATWWFPRRRLDAVRRLLAAHDIELQVPGDELNFKYRYRDESGRFARQVPATPPARPRRTHASPGAPGPAAAGQDMART